MTENEEVKMDFAEYLNPALLKQGQAVPPLMELKHILEFAEALQGIVTTGEVDALLSGRSVYSHEEAVDMINSTLKNSIRTSLFAAYMLIVSMKLNAAAHSMGMTEKQFIEVIETGSGEALYGELYGDDWITKMFKELMDQVFPAEGEGTAKW